MGHEIYVICPYCGESLEIHIDVPENENHQFVEDCSVCCRPWNVDVQWLGDQPQVTLKTDADVF